MFTQNKRQLDRIEEKVDRMAVALPQLQADLSTLQSSVNQIIAALQAAQSPDVTAEDTSVNNMNSQIQAALVPPAS
jgi:outer membrane murein-binding lipoprotein Lpp